MDSGFNHEEQLFEEALKYSSLSDRAAYLDRACKGKPGLRARLNLLLEGHSRSEDFFAASPHSRQIPEDDFIGTMVGQYRVREKIGEGGFGAVYVAEQTRPLKRLVALKIIKLGMDTKQVVLRFEGERQALALMEHPSIARVFDGGATETGRPYFVMELVRGIPITKYCDENSLSTRERLDLLGNVCEAVQHAHQKGIIHRDLKPSNILVTVNDGAAVPKVIDFGVAKAAQQKLTAETIFTQFNHLIGTPAYMSPEQAEISSVDVDTRSDVYSLGVVLYELLTGRTPFDGKSLLLSGLDTMRRTILEQEPLRPSVQLRRQSDPKSNPRIDFDPDLDWIVMKCLEKNRALRYETASALALDIRRYLKNEPVVARPPSASYRLQKFIRRNRLQFSAAMFALAILICAVAVSSWYAVRSHREGLRAESRLKTTIALINQAFEHTIPSLMYTIGAMGPSRDLARDAVKKAEELRADAAFNPELRRALGQLYMRASMIHSYFLGNATGEFAEGLKLAEVAIDLLKPALTEKFDGLQLNRLAYAQMDAGFSAQGLLRPQQALDYFDQMRRTGELMVKSGDAIWATKGSLLMEYANGLKGYTFLQTGEPEKALAYFSPLAAVWKTRIASPSFSPLSDIWDVRDSFDAIGRCYILLGQTTDAVEQFRQALRYADINAQRHPNHAACATMVAESNARLGQALLALGSETEGKAFLEKAVRQADKLRELDRENPGFLRLKVQILQLYAMGYIAWAEQSGGIAPTEQVEEASRMLQGADDTVQMVESRSLRNFLNHEIDQARRRLKSLPNGLRKSAQP